MQAGCGSVQLGLVVGDPGDQYVMGSPRCLYAELKIKLRLSYDWSDGTLDSLI